MRAQLTWLNHLPNPYLPLPRHQWLGFNRRTLRRHIKTIAVEIWTHKVIAQKNNSAGFPAFDVNYLHFQPVFGKPCVQCPHQVLGRCKKQEIWIPARREAKEARKPATSCIVIFTKTDSVFLWMRHHLWHSVRCFQNKKGKNISSLKRQYLG